MNAVLASCPSTDVTLNLSLMCILEKSPVRSWTVTSTVRPMTYSGSAEGVSPISVSLNMRGAWTLYHSFAFHLSFTLRPAAALTFFAGAISMTPFTGRWDSMIVLKAMLESEKMSALKNTHSQTFCTYHIKELFILIGLVPLIFEFNLNFLRVETPRTGHRG